MKLFKCARKEKINKKDSLVSLWLNLSDDYPLVEQMRFPVSFSDKDINYYLSMLKGDTEERGKYKPVLKSMPERSTIILITSCYFGDGEKEYSENLLHKFIFSLTKVSEKPKMVIAVNEAVKLMNEESPLLDTLRILEKQGVQIYVSSSCVEFYKTSEKVKIGTPIDLYEISSYMMNASKVIEI